MSSFKSKYIFFAVLLMPLILCAQQLQINELMPSNQVTIADEDGDYPDWIELYNHGSAGVMLQDLFLSDDSDDLHKWPLPAFELAGQDYLLIYSSDKDRRNFAGHWETVINQGDAWKYFVGVSQPPSNWNSIGFDDSGWLTGNSGIGYGDGDDNTVISQTLSVFLRKKITVADTSQITHLQFHMDFDDAFVAYLNGVEIARAFIGTPGTAPAYNQPADDLHEAQIYQGGRPEFYDINSHRHLLQPGENVLAVQVHNYSTSSSDLSAIPFLTFGMKSEPPNAVGMPHLLRFSLPNLHTNFKLSAQGESVYISDQNSVILDSLIFPAVPADISYGRYPQGSATNVFFENPTPGTENDVNFYSGRVAEVVPTSLGGFYATPRGIFLSTDTPGAQIYYSTDGSEPDQNSTLYTSLIAVAQNTCLRARAYAAGMIPSPIATHTYFINEPQNLPVISLSTNPSNFWDQDSGIYVMGPNAEPGFPHFGANFWQDWERPIHIEYFDSAGQPAFKMNAGVKIFGGWSRGNPQKSLALYARGKYGANEIAYKLFSGEKDIDSFEAVILRNSGNDWNQSMIRDAFMTHLAGNSGVDYQAYQPVVVYLNGEYWGIHNLREKLNEHFIADNNNTQPDQISILENNGDIVHGENDHYLALLDFLNSHSLTDPANYQQVAAMIDIDNFISYQAVEIYCDNTDWPGNNIKFWRENSPGARWRWIAYDFDFGFGIFNANAYQNNTLEFATEPNGPSWPNPPWSTLLLRKLLENSEFKNKFITRYADLINSVLAGNRVYNLVAKFEQGISAEIGRHLNRWGGNISTWNSHIQISKQFAALRPSYARAHILGKFGLSGAASLNLNTNDPNGMIEVNTIAVAEFPWAGVYFKQVPVKLTAVPQPGYKFDGWTGSITSAAAQIIFTPQNDITLTAHFSEDTGLENSLVINEINYNSSDVFDTEDWVEFYNNSGMSLDLSGWQFKDEDDAHIFAFPSGTVLPADSFLLLCRDTTVFNVFFPGLPNITGNMDFGLSGSGELLRVYERGGFLVDSVRYSDSAPWPQQPDGGGPTLSLVHPDSDNGIAGSWGYSAQTGGTPGKPNQTITAINTDQEAEIPHSFWVSQNYPNPFNPVTTFQYSIPRKTGISIRIFDNAGRLVAESAIDRLNPGRYIYQWQPHVSVASGVYFAVFKMDSQNISIRKMIYLK